MIRLLLEVAYVLVVIVASVFSGDLESAVRCDPPRKNFRELIVSQSSGNSGSRVPCSSCAAGTFFSDMTFDPITRNASRMCE